MADGISPVVDTNLGPPAVAPANPIASAGGVVGIMSDLAEMRNRQNANILFQQQMSARHKLGEDLAVWASQGLSPEEQISKASHQPYAPFVTPEIANFRTSNLAGVEVAKNQTEIAELQQRMANSGLGPLSQALAATGGDPTKFDGAFTLATKGYPPELQKTLRPVFDAMKTSILAGVPKDPDAARAKVIENTRNLGMAFGLPLDKAYAMSGGIAPTILEIPTPTGATTKAIVSGGGSGGTSATALGTGPSTAEQEALKRVGAIAGEMEPTFQTLKTKTGAELPTILSGGGGGAAVTASPILNPTTPTPTPIEGPSTAETEAFKIAGQQAAGLAPSVEKFKLPSGAEEPFYLSGKGSASPLLTPPAGGAGGSGSPIVGPSATQSKYLESRGTDMADYQKSLDERVKMGQSILQTVEPAWDAMQDLKKSGQTPGGLASARMAIAQIAQGLGASPDVVDRISKLSDTQEISKLMVNTTMSQISQQLPSMSKMAVSEFNAFTKNNPSLDTDPRAIEKIFNFWSHVQDINKTEQSEMNRFLRKGGNVSEWPEEWQRIAEERGLVKANPTGTGGEVKSRPPIESFFK